MFYVYSGYVSPDNYDNSEMPIYTITVFETAGEVIAAKKEFDEDLYDECSNVIFRVIEGEERNIKPVSVITEWKLD